jgi:hypothetical protein
LKYSPNAANTKLDGSNNTTANQCCEQAQHHAAAIWTLALASAIHSSTSNHPKEGVVGRTKPTQKNTQNHTTKEIMFAQQALKDIMEKLQKNETTQHTKQPTTPQTNKKPKITKR